MTHEEMCTVVGRQVVDMLVYLLPREHTKLGYEKYRAELIEQYGYSQFREWQRQAFREIFGDKSCEGGTNGVD